MWGPASHDLSSGATIGLPTERGTYTDEENHQEADEGKWDKPSKPQPRSPDPAQFAWVKGGSLASSAAKPLSENSDFLVKSERAEVRFGFIGIPPLPSKLMHRGIIMPLRCVRSAPSTNGRMTLVNQR